jgi:SagB-type dehydrogenase family enzyme
MMFRRVPTIVGWWRGADFQLQDFATNATFDVDPADLRLLGVLAEWRTVREAAARSRRPAREVRASLERFTARGLVERSNQPATRAQQALKTWADWSPAAALFHFTTKDLTYRDWRYGNEAVRAWLTTDPMPPPVKAVRGERTSLPAYDRRSPFARVLLSRRSWRRFGTAATTLEQLSTLLGLTWGTQQWMQFGEARLALKTSPSGGACHSLEAYVAVRRVRGLEPRLYHYDPDAHALVARPKKWSARWITRCLGGQEFFAEADAVVFMTSVFERAQWKYRYPRAYRAVLLEAGHFCQTFCLTATALGLAPFCTAALGDSAIERGLGVDGVRESVLYAMGVGTRPRGVAWAPYPVEGLPPLSLPAHRRESRRRGSREAR